MVDGVVRVVTSVDQAKVCESNILGQSGDAMSYHPGFEWGDIGNC